MKEMNPEFHVKNIIDLEITFERLKIKLNTLNFAIKMIIKITRNII